MVRRRTMREFRFFFLYTACSIVVQLALIIIAGVTTRSAYFKAFWIAQAVYVCLALLAMNESFRKIFRAQWGDRWWFGFLVPGTALSILALSTWKVLVRAPLQARGLMDAFIFFDLASNYMRAGVFGLFALLVFRRQPPWQQYSFAILRGFGLFSIVGTVADLLRSDYGTRMNLFFAYGSAVAYLFACLIWLLAFARPEPVKPQKSSVRDVELEKIVEILRKLTTRIR